MTHRARRIGPRLWNRARAIRFGAQETERLRREREARITEELRTATEDGDHGVLSVSEMTRQMLEDDHFSVYMQPLA